MILEHLLNPPDKTSVLLKNPPQIWISESKGVLDDEDSGKRVDVFFGSNCKGRVFFIIYNLEVLSNVINGIGHFIVQIFNQFHWKSAAIELDSMKIIEFLDFLGELVVESLRDFSKLLLLLFLHILI